MPGKNAWSSSSEEDEAVMELAVGLTLRDDRRVVAVVPLTGGGVEAATGLDEVATGLEDAEAAR